MSEGPSEREEGGAVTPPASRNATRSAIGLRTVAMVLAALFVGLGAGYAVWGIPPEADSIVIAIQPTASATEIAPQAAELEAFLEERVGVQVSILVPTTYAATIEAIRFGHADVGFMSAWPAYLANKHAGADLVLAEVREVTIGEDLVEETFYFSHFVVLADSPYQTLEDVRGLRIAFSSPLSTSGYLYPVDRLIQLGLIPRPDPGAQADPLHFFGSVTFAGGYAQAWQALLAGQADVAIIAGDVSASLYEEVLAGTRILETQGPIPSHGVVFSDGFVGPLRERLVAALLELGNPEHRDLMRRLVSGIFVGFEIRTTEQHLGPLATALESTGFEWVERIG